MLCGKARLRLGRCSWTVPVVATLLVAAGCGASQRGPQVGETVLRVTERDFKISAPKRVAAGDVRLLVHNRGPDDHELIVVRLQGSGLPFRAGGMTVDEDALEPLKAGALEPGLPGALRELRLHLAPGRYVLFCNMRGHYRGGMHVELAVQ